MLPQIQTKKVCHLLSQRINSQYYFEKFTPTVSAPAHIKSTTDQCGQIKRQRSGLNIPQSNVKNGLKVI